MMRVIAWCGWVLALFSLGYLFFAPTSLWLEYSELTISNGYYGGVAPGVTATQTFNRTFLAHWYRTLERCITGPNDPPNSCPTWHPVCFASGEENRYPGWIGYADENLETYFSYAECAKRPLPGKYFVEDDLAWNDLVITRSVTIESNLFDIEPRQQTPRAAPHYDVRPATPLQYHRPKHPRSTLPWFLQWLSH